MAGTDEERLRFEADEHMRRAKKDLQILESDARETALTVALVGCGKQKKGTRCKARDMYTGTLFKLAYAHAERTADDVHIISALHGLLPPYDEIDSYDLSINQLLLSEQRDWANGIVSDLFTFYPLTRLRILFYASQAYIRPILEASLHQVGYWEMRSPLEGLDLFARIRWFRAQKEKA